MGWIISTNESLLETLQLKIHNYMKANVENYNAVRWSNVIKHPTENNYAMLIKETDKRFPYKAITKTEKLQLIDKLPNEFFENVINHG